jgi:hypothetical protein
MFFSTRPNPKLNRDDSKIFSNDNNSLTRNIGGVPLSGIYFANVKKVSLKDYL